MSGTTQGRTFEPPGPGAWELDQTHFTRPLTAFSQEYVSEPFGRGFAEGTARYAVQAVITLLRLLEIGYTPQSIGLFS